MSALCSLFFFSAVLRLQVPALARHQALQVFRDRWPDQEAEGRIIAYIITDTLTCSVLVCRRPVRQCRVSARSVQQSWTEFNGV